MHLKVLSANCLPFCSGLKTITDHVHEFDGVDEVTVFVGVFQLGSTQHCTSTLHIHAGMVHW